MPTTVGFLYPGYAAEDDYPRLAERITPEVSLRLVHTSLGPDGDAHTVAALHTMGEAERLEAGVAQLRADGVEAVVWACTSGSFVYGWEGAHEQARRLAQVAGVPASSASLAFVSALRRLGLRRVAVAATYPDEVSRCFAEFLDAGGIEVLDVRSSDIMTATLAGDLDAEAVMSMAAAADRPQAEAVLLPDTALHTVSVLDRVEQLLGKTVLTANQVCVWEALRLAGLEHAHASAGRLFRTGPRSAAPEGQVPGSPAKG